MKFPFKCVAIVALLFAASCVLAQLQFTSADLAEIEATAPTSADELPIIGTFYSAANPQYPPAPADILGFPAWDIGNVGTIEIYMLDDLGASSGGGSYAMDDDEPPIPGGGDGGGGGTYTFTNTYAFPTNGLWLQITNLSDDSVYANLNGATDLVYEIYSTTNLAVDALAVSNWDIESEVFPVNTNTTPFNVSMNGRSNLFLWARDWTEITSLGNMTPEWWFYYYFGTVNLVDTNMDSLGENTLLYDFQHGHDPNVLLFSLDFTNDYFYANPVSASVSIQTGEPFYKSVLINDVDFDDAVWQPLTSTNISFDLGVTNGAYTVFVGLRGLPTNATPTWQGTQVSLNLTPFVLTVTNLISSVISQSLVQVQGYVARPLASLTFDVSNETGVFTNQVGYITGQFYDPNLQMVTTNYFQCYDVRMAPGLNAVTLHATDTEGDMTSMIESLDYSPGTNPPSLAVLWPQGGTLISGNSFTLQGQIDDVTATITVQITDTNGDVNTVHGLAERDGTIWVNNLPMNPGANLLVLTATNAAGYSMTTNLTLVQSAVTVTMDPLTQFNQSSVSITGTSSDENYGIYVNGIGAYYLDTNGDWEADDVPVSPTGTASFNLQVYTGDPVLSGSENFVQDQPPIVVLKDYSYVDDTAENQWDVHQTFHDTIQWDNQSGGAYNELQVGIGLGEEGENGGWHSIDDTVNESLSPDTTNGWFAFTPTWENASLSLADETKKVQSDLMLTPSGKAVPGETRLCLVLSQVTNELTGLQEPASEVQFTSQLAGTPSLDMTNPDGNVWTEALVSYPPGVMPTVTPKGKNISYSGTYSTNFSLEIIDNNTGSILSGQTNTVIVGQQMNLICELSATNATSWSSILTNFQWTVPGNAISDYLVAQDASSAVVTTNFPTTNSNVAFYWIDGASNRVLQCSAMIGGVMVSNAAVINVIKPTIDFTGSIGTVSLDTNYVFYPGTSLSLHLGGTLDSGVTNYGITCVASNPDFYGYDTNSNAGFFVAQIITSDSINAIATNQMTISTNFEGLDNFYPVQNLGNGNGTSFYDAPGESGFTTTLTRLSVSNSFRAFLMFLPDEPGEIVPVPVREVDWSWSGTAVLTNGQWALESSNAVIAANNANTLVFPTWTNVVHNYNMQ